VDNAPLALFSLSLLWVAVMTIGIAVSSYKSDAKDSAAPKTLADWADWVFPAIPVTVLTLLCLTGSGFLANEVFQRYLAHLA